MSHAKAEIFATIRRGLKTPADDSARQARVQTRLQTHPRNCIPARAQLAQPEQVALFEQMAREAAAELIELRTLDELPHILSTLADQLDNPPLICADQPEFSQLDEKALKIERRVARAGDIISLTTCFRAIAETGTLMLHSSARSPTTLNFLPDIHLLLVRQSQVVGTYEDAWQALREQGADMPRTVNMITGPSRSADIEQKLQMGAHGPKRLILLLLRD